MENRYIVSVLVENHAGVLSRIAGLFSRRGYNIASLTAGETKNPSVSRMTIEFLGSGYDLEQVTKQLAKLEDVLTVMELKADDAVLRELLLVKVSADDATRPAIVEAANIFRAKVVDISRQTLTMEVTGEQRKIDAFIDLMSAYDIREIARTGLTALQRGNAELTARAGPALGEES